MALETHSARILTGARACRYPGLRWRRAMSRPRVLFGLCFIGLLLFVAFSAPLLAPHDPNFQSRLESGGGVFLPPFWASDASSSHPLGTDKLGRDLLSRILYGTRISVMAGIVPMVLSTVLGLGVGIVAGMRGGWTDELLMRFTDAMFAFPDLLFVLVLVAAARGVEVGPFTLTGLHIGRTALLDLWGGIPLIFTALALVAWVSTARLVRAQALSLTGREFILATKVTGLTEWRTMHRHLLPNCLAPAIVAATLQVPRFVLTEAFLSFIGLGVRPPAVSWGSVLRDGYTSINAISQAVWIPTLCISLLTLACAFLGEALREALDPLDVTTFE